jgi:hypothetical protein
VGTWLTGDKVVDERWAAEAVAGRVASDTELIPVVRIQDLSGINKRKKKERKILS